MREFIIAFTPSTWLQEKKMKIQSSRNQEAINLRLEQNSLSMSELLKERKKYEHPEFGLHVLNVLLMRIVWLLNKEILSLRLYDE